MYRFTVAAAVAFGAFILWVIYLKDTGTHAFFFNIINYIPLGDKVGHFCLFGVLSYLATAALKFKTLNLAGQPIFLGAILVLSFALLEELTQGLIPSRTLDAGDLVADLLGVSFFHYLAHLTQKKIQQRSAELNAD